MDRNKIEQEVRNNKESRGKPRGILLPRKLLAKAVQENFQSSLPFRFDEAAAFQLGGPNGNEALLAADCDSLDRELSLACASKFQSRYFEPLYKELAMSSNYMDRHSRERGNPYSAALSLDSRFRGNDVTDQ